MSEEMARQFHEIYERLAPAFGYETRVDTKEFDPKSPNGQLMIAVTDAIENLYDISALRSRVEELTAEQEKKAEYYIYIENERLKEMRRAEAAESRITMLEGVIGELCRMFLRIRPYIGHHTNCVDMSGKCVCGSAEIQADLEATIARAKEALND